MHGVCEHEHGIQPFLSPSAHIPRHVFHLLPTRLRRPRVYQPEHPRLRRRSHGGDVVRAEQIDPRKSDGKVDDGYRKVDPDGVPSVFFHEHFESFRE